MVTFVFILLACALLVASILMQNNQGGGIQSQFVTANKIIGARRANKFMAMTTVGLAAVLVILTLVIGLNY